MSDQTESPLRAARLAVGLTRPELAHSSGVSVRHIEALEVGERRAGPDVAALLERAMLRAACARLDRIEDAVTAVARLDDADPVDPVDAGDGGAGVMPPPRPPLVVRVPPGQGPRIRRPPERP